MRALGFNQVYFVCKVWFITTDVQKNPFTPRPVTDVAQLLSLPLKYFKES